MGYLLDIARKIRLPQRVDPLYYEKNELNELTSSSVIDNSPSTELRPPEGKSLTRDNRVPIINVDETWPAKTQSLVDWFLTLDPPPEPFYLENHLHVLDPAKFFDTLRHEIESGPSGPRARTGTLQSDLRQLKEYFN